MTFEVWKDISGYEGIYKISNLGRVLSVARIDKRGWKRKEKILKPALNDWGYKFVVLQDKKSKVVHRLVAKEFCANPKHKPYTNHIDGDKTNNRAENLEWVTHQENILHACRSGLRKTPKGENNHNARLRNKQAEEIRSEYKKSEVTHKQLAEKYNVSDSVIQKVLNYKTYI
ncbi:NUMOD4 domain-containing protein [Jeotgalibaca porci]|uniref:NUMOD4 domain-containing protein n=1 Tax=Jeotgalibaca porci TaxID=1868793 RepID=UPI0035A00E19